MYYNFKFKFSNLRFKKERIYELKIRINDFFPDTLNFDRSKVPIRLTFPPIKNLKLKIKAIFHQPSYGENRQKNNT